MTDFERDLLSKIDSIQASLDRDMKKLEATNKVHRLKFFMVWLLVIAMFIMGLWVRDSNRDANRDLANTFEKAQVINCETSKQGRENIRGVFMLFLEMVIARDGDSSGVLRQFADEFELALSDALPDRNCEQEAKERLEES